MKMTEASKEILQLIGAIAILIVAALFIAYADESVPISLFAFMLVCVALDYVLA